MSSLVPAREPAILPGSTIGILGSGQLGRMLALAARSLGYRVHVFSPEADAPAASVSDKEFVASYQDLEAIRSFARGVDVVTFEFENISSEATSTAAQHVPVRPSGSVLSITQNRLREKGFLQSRGFPVTPFRPVHCLDDLKRAAADLGLPCVMKTANFGYDGKGQFKLLNEAELEPAWDSISGAPAIYERFVPFAKEISVIGARTADGHFEAFPVFENTHTRHILDISVAPARVDATVERDARHLAEQILDALGVVGVLTVEMFLTSDNRILINELAPRVHNSGHLTLDACITSQFEQQVRAVCGLPLGSTTLLRPAAMSNLLGDLWENGEPDWVAALENPAVKLHLYGKREARSGRKMGHLTATGSTASEAVHRVVEARARLSDASQGNRLRSRT